MSSRFDTPLISNTRLTRGLGEQTLNCLSALRAARAPSIREASPALEIYSTVEQSTAIWEWLVTAARSAAVNSLAVTLSTRPCTLITCQSPRVSVARRIPVMSFTCYNRFQNLVDLFFAAGWPATSHTCWQRLIAPAGLARCARRRSKNPHFQANSRKTGPLCAWHFAPVVRIAQGIHFVSVTRLVASRRS